MLYVLLSICCSVAVSIMLKLAKRYHVDVLQAITWNYSIAIVLTWLIFKPHWVNLDAAPINILGGLGILLPVLFVILAASVTKTGIVRTDVAQRLSLFIPILASYFIFGEHLSLIKIAGIVVGLIAILCSIPWGKSGGKATSGGWFYLLVVFVGMGVIDVLFKQLSAVKSVPYTSLLFMVFVLAFICAFIMLIIKIISGKTKFSFPHILIGWTLGVANFGNILFYLKAHQALVSKPSTVFTAMNIGVIVLGTLVGLFIFKEKLSTLNKVGIFLALIAVIVIFNF
ncbi:DMT family transporter [Mucilaginibacter sp. dw_454]|uniref:DMT family transporter n=1 Tax=Mucilaginibacter sp. dw_454 TaxID=2720079 RepID=UPI001BD4A824|nr:DMT family transporter [Mucilaginibacter sp. dw_454]